VITLLHGDQARPSRILKSVGANYPALIGSSQRAEYYEFQVSVVESIGSYMAIFDVDEVRGPRRQMASSSCVCKCSGGFKLNEALTTRRDRTQGF
jgi:hypothetical protein